MMMAPMMRVESPHDVVQQCCNWPFWSRYLTSKAWAKFCPRKCDVPGCSTAASPLRCSRGAMMGAIKFVQTLRADFMVKNVAQVLEAKKLDHKVQLQDCWTAYRKNSTS